MWLERVVPSSTYRLQLNSNLTFRQVRELLDYFRDLGVGTLYVSPILQARSGSTHGYDIIDHGSINTELGSSEAFDELAAALRQADMGLMIDIVPNHMCIADAGNWRWRGVLEDGPSSPEARFFDIDWRPPRPDLWDKVLLPVLGEQYGRILENRELRVEYAAGAFSVRYWEHSFPLAPRSWIFLLGAMLGELRSGFGESHEAVLELESIITAIGYLPLRAETDQERVRERQREKIIIKSRLASLLERSSECAAALRSTLEHYNGVRGDASSFDALELLLADQAYRLSYWRVAADEINYRRFFDVNELAAIRVEDPVVFDAVHEKVLDYIRRRWVTGVRVDHPDGLYDPVQYFHDLQAASSAASMGTPVDEVEPERKSFYVVAEKILSGDERRRKSWTVSGTTGYGFLNQLNAAFIDPDAEEAMNDAYTRFTGVTTSFEDLAYWCKRLILRVSMSSELSVLARRLDRICQQHRHSRDFTFESLRLALRETTACFRVYRTYIREHHDEVDDEDRRHILDAIHTAKLRNPAVSASVFDLLASVLLLQDPPGLTEEQRAERRLFIMRFQQLTGPVMAKGIEDTAFYRRFPLASINEVGADAEVFGITADEFHNKLLARYADWPHNLATTSTHDTKRSEDVRARMNVLSEVPSEWAQTIDRWRNLNAKLKTLVEGTPTPDSNTAYLLYQTLVAAWPLEHLDGTAPDRAFVERIQRYMEKATREAKLHTSWISPHHDYDRAVQEFVARALADSAFIEDLTRFVRSIIVPGLLNSVSQVVLKLTCPGVPDIYQGNELWDFSLVDPDNRRPVDFAHRARLLESLRLDCESPVPDLIDAALRNIHDGRLKLFVTHRLLRFRREQLRFFLDADYIPLRAAGTRNRNIISFARTALDQSIIVAAGRFFVGLGCRAGYDGARVWADSDIIVPETIAAAEYRNVISGRTVQPVRSRGQILLPLDHVLADLPVAVLHAEIPPTR
jgi:(1->4)-alpha-D-glucan 1-alpha-D-glucosylmutase